MSYSEIELGDPMTFDEFADWCDEHDYIPKVFAPRVKVRWAPFRKSEYLRRLFPSVPNRAQFLMLFQLDDGRIGRRNSAKHYRIVETFWRLLLQNQSADTVDVSWFDARYGIYDEPFVPDLYAHNGGMSTETREELRKFVNHNSAHTPPLYPFTRNSCEIFPLMLLKLYDSTMVVEAMRWWIREEQSFDMDVFVRIVEQWYDVKDLTFSWAVETVREHPDEPIEKSRRRRTR